MENIKNKADYCLGCINKPCSKSCPLNNDTAGFIKLVKEQKYKEAFELLCETTVLQPICGRICPHTKQCQKGCIRRNKRRGSKHRRYGSLCRRLSNKKQLENS